MFNVNAKAFKNMVHFVKFQFCMLYINFRSEHLSVSFDGMCFSTVVFLAGLHAVGAEGARASPLTEIAYAQICC